MYYNELHDIGESLILRSSYYLHIDFIWNHAKKVRQSENPLLEFQKYFGFYASQGMLHDSGLFKMLKECPGLLDTKVFTIKMIELQFSKVKGQGDKKLSYTRFIDLMATFAAIKFLNIDPLLLGSYSGTMDPFSDSFAYRNLVIAGKGKGGGNNTVNRPGGAGGVENAGNAIPSAPTPISVPVTVGMATGGGFTSLTTQAITVAGGGPNPVSVGASSGADGNIIGVPVMTQVPATTATSMTAGIMTGSHATAANAASYTSTAATGTIPVTTTTIATATAATVTNTMAVATTSDSVKKQHISNKVGTVNNTRAINAANRTEAEAAIMSYRYGRLYGRPALLVKFIFQYFFHAPVFKKILEELDTPTAKKPPCTCQSLSLLELRRQAHRIGLFLHQKLGMKKMNRYLAMQANMKYEQHRCSAAIRIQKVMRGEWGRRISLDKAQEMYRKYIDTELQVPYWYNERTSKSFWTKPVLLQYLDCGFPVSMANPDEQFIVNCSVCQSNQAKFFCLNCNIQYCKQCFNEAHKGGKRKGHSSVSMQNCALCSYQMGAKYCVQCKESYCDVCYTSLHRKGRLAVHSFLRGGPACDWCKDRTAQWRRLRPDDDTSLLPDISQSAVSIIPETFLIPLKSFLKVSTKIGNPTIEDTNENRDMKMSEIRMNEAISLIHKPVLQLFCTVCHVAYFGDPRPMITANKEVLLYYEENMSHSRQSEGVSLSDIDPSLLYPVEQLPFYGLEGVKSMETHLRMTQLREMELQYNLYHKNLAFELNRRRVTVIQKMFRGWRIRKENSEVIQFIQNRRQLMILRKKQAFIRNSSIMWLLKVFGIAPTLSSDTPYERMLKKYPLHQHVVIAAIVDHKWKVAVAMWREQVNSNEQIIIYSNYTTNPIYLHEHSIAYL